VSVLFNQWLCRYLGNTLNSQYGAGVGSVGLENVQCVGTETSLYDCPRSEVWAAASCAHSQDVSVACLEEGKK